MNVEVKEYPPCPMLCDFIDCYWHAVFPAALNQVNEIKILPSGFVDLILHRSIPKFVLVRGEHSFYSTGFILGGLWTTPCNARFSDRTEVFSIRLKPEAMTPLLEISPSQFVNTAADLDDVLKGDHLAFCRRIKDAATLKACIVMADSFFSQYIRRIPRHKGYVHRAAELIRKTGASSVEQLSNDVCISRRQLERQFKESLGVSPKMYIRISRMNRMLRLLKAESLESLSQLSSAAGYFDQAHFIKDFRIFAGEAPATFLRRSRDFLNV